MDKFQNIISNAAKYYDYVIVDLKKGLKFNQQLEILQNSNIVVANIDQRIKTIQSYIETKEIAGMINKTIWNICKYDKNSKYNTKNIIRTILRKGYVYETDYNTLVFESAQEGDWVGLLIKFRTLKEDDTNKIFFNKIDELVQGIIFKNQEIRTKI